MRKILFLALALVFGGCTTRRLGVESFENATRFRILNESGVPLHNLRVKIYVEQARVMHYGKDTLWDMDVNGKQDSELKFPTGMVQIQIYGRCNEGRLRGSWYGQETP